MERDECFVHPVVGDAVGPAVKAPAALADVARSLADHHSKTGRAPVEDDPFNHLLAPRTRPRNEHNITVRKPMLGKTPAVLCLEHDDVFTEESALNSSFEVEQRHPSHQQALL